MKLCVFLWSDCQKRPKIPYNFLIERPPDYFYVLLWRSIISVAIIPTKLMVVLRFLLLVQHEVQMQTVTP